MIIETKYNLGDEVYFIFDTQFAKGAISGIAIGVGGEHGETPMVAYQVEHELYNIDIDTTIPESECFSALVDLVNYHKNKLLRLLAENNEDEDE